VKPATFAVLNNTALRHNLNVVRQYAPGAKVMAVIKANGYGHGLIRVAKELRTSDAFAVARVDEGIRLRKAGITQRIVVLEGFVCHEELALIERFQMETVLHCDEQLDMLESIDTANYINCWLKLDTGMHRLGFDVTQVTRVINRINQCRSIAKPVPLMTHLANADDVNDSATDQQIKIFNNVTAHISEQRSIANSSGILEWKTSLSDWVRPGIMLFGVSPFSNKNGTEYGLKPALTLYSKLLAIKDLKVGDAVGYGGLWVCKRPMKLGVIATGYGDGYPRSAASNTPVLVNGCRAPLVGRVSMDMITVDLTHCQSARIGDQVVLWGEELPVEEIARCASTIPYTLMCGITQRVMIIEEEIDRN